MVQETLWGAMEEIEACRRRHEGKRRTAGSMLVRSTKARDEPLEGGQWTLGYTYRGSSALFWCEHSSHHEGIERPWDVAGVHVRAHHPGVQGSGYEVGRDRAVLGSSSTLEFSVEKELCKLGHPVLVEPKLWGGGMAKKRKGCGEEGRLWAERGGREEGGVWGRRGRLRKGRLLGAGRGVEGI